MESDESWRHNSGATRVIVWCPILERRWEESNNLEENLTNFRKSNVLKTLSTSFNINVSTQLWIQNQIQEAQKVQISSFEYKTYKLKKKTLLFLSTNCFNVLAASNNDQQQSVKAIEINAGIRHDIAGGWLQTEATAARDADLPVLHDLHTDIRHKE